LAISGQRYRPRYWSCGETNRWRGRSGIGKARAAAGKATALWRAAEDLTARPDGPAPAGR